MKTHILALLLWSMNALAATPEHTLWVKIDTHEQTLAVIQDNHIRELFTNVSFGRNGYSPLRRQGDGRTPLGTFRVAWINLNSKFHFFFGLDYPNHEHAEQAFRSKLIDFDTYFNIRTALFRGRLPPQNTQLGGYIGIHGVGKGSPRVHDIANWTDGCVALTNEQVEKLARWVTVGTRVTIQ